ncbi:MAG: hypothetical protein VZQ47_08785 [Treponema sp.]|nr:hypothetical protein [Treponema sp.]MEE3435638.1 hypothetical protein [Treponema sp.]
MKLIKAKKLVLASFAAVAVALVSGCQDVIYWNIRKEVTLKDANIKSDIRSIIRFKDQFYCANGNIYRKSNTSNSYGTWSKTGAPSGQVLKLAADKDYIYALVGISKDSSKDGENIPVRRELWYSSDGSSWSKVTGVYGNGDIAYSSSSRTYLFGTNAIKEANRSAYFILIGGAPGNRAYKLNGDSSVEILDWSTTNADTKPTTSSQSCVYDGSAVRFFNSTGSCTNESSAGGDATIYYYGDGSTLKWGEKGSPTLKGSVGAKAGILSLGVTKDYILVGTSSGITHHPLTEGVPGSRASNMPYNAEATLSAQYNILSILVVNPEKNETETAIYASQNYTGNGSNSAQFDHICMWAYYPERHEWNRD